MATLEEVYGAKGKAEAQRLKTMFGKQRTEQEQKLGTLDELYKPQRSQAIQNQFLQRERDKNVGAALGRASAVPGGGQNIQQQLSSNVTLQNALAGIGKQKGLEERGIRNNLTDIQRSEDEALSQSAAEIGYSLLEALRQQQQAQEERAYQQQLLQEERAYQASLRGGSYSGSSGGSSGSIATPTGEIGINDIINSNGFSILGGASELGKVINREPRPQTTNEIYNSNLKSIYDNLKSVSNTQDGAMKYLGTLSRDKLNAFSDDDYQSILDYAESLDRAYYNDIRQSQNY